MAAAQKKGMYHSELAGMGDNVVVDVLGDVTESKYKKGAYWVSIGVDGRERQLHLENENCEAEMRDRKGQRLTLTALGSREDATIDVSDAGWTPNGEKPAKSQSSGRREPQQQSRRAEPPQQQQRQQPARQQPSQRQQQTRPANNQPLPNTNAALVRLTNLEIKIQVSVGKICDELKSKRGIELTDTQKGGIAGRFFIELCKTNHLASMPSDHVVDCSPKETKADPNHEQSDEEESEPSDNDGGAN